MKLIATKGLPASGKSTWAKEMEAKGNWVRLSMDDIRKFVMFKDDKFSEKKERIARKLQKAMALSFKESGYSVIFDDTNLNPKTMNKVKVFAEENGFNFEIKNFHKNLTLNNVYEFIERDEKREKKVGESVIFKMVLQYYPELFKDKKFVICDIDGTIADIKHRLKYVKNLTEGEKPNWKKFFENIDKDLLIKSTFKILANYYSKGFEIIFVTARPEEYREISEKWLKKKMVFLTLIMRKTADRREDTEIKSDIYENYLKNLNIETIIDDRPRVIRMWESKGVKVINVGDGKEF